MAEALLESIVACQKRHGYTDAEFARRLGLPRSTWSLTKRGIKQVGPRVYSAAVREFPELEPNVLAFLRESVYCSQRESITVNSDSTTAASA